MSKKYFILIIVLTIIVINKRLYTQESWQVISTPVNVNLYKVFYLDSLHLWAAGDSGTIIFSSDKGISWSVQNYGLENSIFDIFFLNNYLGWAVTWQLDGTKYQSKILQSFDGGINWLTENYPYQNVILRTIFFNDELNGWAGGDPSELSYTTDGGRTWLPAVFDTSYQLNFPVREIKFSTTNYGFAVGGAIDLAGAVWFTVNSGQSWKGYIVAPDIFDDFIFLDSANAYSLSADIEFIYPIGKLLFNLEQNLWSYNELNQYGRVTGIDKRTHSEFWGTIGNMPSFILSKDRGETWDFFPTPNNYNVFDIAFLDSLNGIAVGEAGKIFLYKNNTSKFIDDAPTFLSEFTLNQNFPNPFNSSTKISWWSSKNDYHKLRVFDSLGNEITVLLKEFKTAGYHEIEFDTSELESSIGRPLTSGIYFYQLQSGNKLQTKKMLLLK